MKIVVYNPNDEKYQNFRDSLASKLSTDKRIELICKWVEENGREITPQNYWENRHKYSGWSSKDDKVVFFGEPNGALEKIIDFVDNSASYIHMSERFPEDFVESRTDWYSMQGYCDDMASLIKDIGNELTK